MTPTTVPAIGTLDEVLATGSVRSVYQPIVDLFTGDIVGYEALARGPQDGPLASPAALFGAAAAAGRIAELDCACRAAAVAGARAMLPDLALFVNVEPGSVGGDPATDPLHDARLGSPVVIEVTERMLCDRPAELLAYLAEMRTRGHAVALDDVGAVDDSLALMPFLRPDVVKLDLALVQERPRRAHGAIMAAVLAYAEESGATILAEGIETEEHREIAIGLGATLGQGWLFARPSTDVSAPAPAEPLHLLSPTITGARRRADDGAPRTPFDLVAAARRTRPGRRSRLLGLSRHLESVPLGASSPTVVVAAFQRGDRFTAATARRYAQLAEVCSFVAALGVDLPLEPVPGVRGATLAPDDPLEREWVVAVVGPHHAHALVARERPDGGDDPVFDYAVTHDRRLVVEAAAALLHHVVPR